MREETFIKLHLCAMSHIKPQRKHGLMETAKILESDFHSFIHNLINLYKKCLLNPLCIRHCARYWGYMVKNHDLWPYETTVCWEKQTQSKSFPQCDSKLQSIINVLGKKGFENI